MKFNMRYIIFLMLIFIIGLIFPLIFTNAKYYYNINMESNLDIGYMIFNIKQKNGEPNIYEINKGEKTTAKYILTNKDENNYINKLDLKYYIKVLNENGEEQSDFEIEIDGYNYIEYNIDDQENIRDENGNITDEKGNIIEEVELTEEENKELQGTLTHVRKGFGPINLCYDGMTLSEEEIVFRIKCLNNYNGNDSVSLKISVIAEGLSNKEFTYTEEIDLKIHISSIVQSNSETNANSNEENIDNNQLEMRQEDSNQVENNQLQNNQENNNEISNNEIIENSIQEQNENTLNEENPINNQEKNTVNNELDNQNTEEENVI